MTFSERRETADNRYKNFTQGLRDAEGEVPPAVAAPQPPAAPPSPPPEHWRRKRSAEQAPDPEAAKPYSVSPDADLLQEPEISRPRPEVDLRQMEAAMGQKRLDEIAAVVRALTYGEMIELATAIWGCRGGKEVTEEELPAILHRWSTSDPSKSQT